MVFDPPMTGENQQPRLIEVSTGKIRHSQSSTIFSDSLQTSTSKPPSPVEDTTIARFVQKSNWRTSVRSATMSTTIFVDARDDKLASSAEKERLALNHFSFFLKSHCLQMGVKAVEATQIPCHGIPKKKSKKTIFEFWDLMIGAFFTYMLKEARISCKSEANRLA